MPIGPGTDLTEQVEALAASFGNKVDQVAQAVEDLYDDVVNSLDPNSLTGPAGYGSSDFVAAGTLLPYRIDFENAPTASAPAQRVVVTDQLDPNLDWTTLQLTGVGFGDTNLTIPPDSQDYETTVPMTYNGESFVVEIQIGLNPATGMLTAVFQSIDPSTQLPPDVLTGFLPPEDGTGRGMGFLSYIIQPKSGLPTGTQIRNVALITFDVNPPIATDQVSDSDPSQGTDPTKMALVTIDADPPTSTVAALPAYTGTPSFTVSWSGSDGAGSGVASYDIYVSTDGGAFTPFVTDTTATSATFAGASGHTYAFYSVATDNVGNRQPTPTAAQATTQVVVPVDTTTSVKSSEDPSQLGDSLTFTATVAANSSGAPTPTGSVQFLIDGNDFGSPVALVNGSATSGTIATLVVGNHTVTAQYQNGDARFNPGQGSLPGGETVDPGNVTVQVASSDSESSYGQSLTFTATMSGSSAGLPVPGGTVQFEIDGALFGAPVVVVGGQAVSTSTATIGAGSAHHHRPLFGRPELRRQFRDLRSESRQGSSDDHRRRSVEDLRRLDIHRLHRPLHGLCQRRFVERGQRGGELRRVGRGRHRRRHLHDHAGAGKPHRGQLRLHHLRQRRLDDRQGAPDGHRRRSVENL